MRSAGNHGIQCDFTAVKCFHGQKQGHDLGDRCRLKRFFRVEFVEHLTRWHRKAPPILLLIAHSRQRGCMGRQEQGAKHRAEQLFHRILHLSFCEKVCSGKGKYAPQKAA